MFESPNTKHEQSLNILRSPSWLTLKAGLIVGHPGHELRVFGWLKKSQPQVCVLTDGSGRNQKSRLASTEQILLSTNSKPGPVFGRFTDQQIYQALLDSKAEIFIHLAQELAHWIAREQFDYVVGDAAEGYNSTHDLCHMLLATSCTLASAKLGKEIPFYDFLLVGHPAETGTREAWRITLEDNELSEKLSLASAYHAISGDVKLALEEFGADAFRVEIFNHATQQTSFALPREAVPFYERYGQQQVSAGFYRYVIRYREHIAPLARVLQHQIKTNTP